MKPKPEFDLTPRYAALVRMVARYRIMLREVAGALLAPSHDVITSAVRLRQLTLGGNALARLAQNGYLNHHRAGDPRFPPLPGDVPYFTLTKLGAAAAGVPKERAVAAGKQAFGLAALNQHLSALWFAIMTGAPGFRLDPHESATLLGEHASFRNVPFCLRHEAEGWRLYRLYQPATELSRIAEDVARIVFQMRSHPNQGTWLKGGDLGLAILAAEPSACRDIDQVLTNASLGGPVHFLVHWTPTVESAADFLARWKSETPK